VLRQVDGPVVNAIQAPELKPLGQSSTSKVRGQYPAETRSQGPDLLWSLLFLARKLVERFLNKVRPCRHVATRYDKLAANDLAFVQFASNRPWLRVNESAP